MRIGHVHVPKTGGTSVNRAFAKALDIPEVHILRVGTAAEIEEWGVDSNRCIVKGSLAESLARSSPYLAGHIAPDQMRSLARDYIFAVLREPIDRLMSLYRYGRAHGLGIDAATGDGQHSSWAIAAGRESFLDFIAHGYGRNGQTRTLMRGTDELRTLQASSKHFTVALPDLAAELMDTVLQQYDCVFVAGDYSKLGMHLAQATGVEGLHVGHENKSSDEIERPVLDSSDETLELMHVASWADSVLIDVARQRFPQTLSRSNY